MASSIRVDGESETTTIALKPHSGEVRCIHDERMAYSED